MTPEQFVQQLRVCLGDGLKSVVLYGSAATGDFIEGVSGYNLLVVADPLGAAELKTLSAATGEWERAGNPWPQFLTPAELSRSGDAFPIEILDMQRSGKLLFGADLLTGISVELRCLRTQLEHELKSKMLFLRQRYVAACVNPERAAKLFTSSLSTFLVLSRAALTLYDEEIPLGKVEALQMLAGHIPFDAEPFLTVLELKTLRKTAAEIDIESLAPR